MTAEPGSWWLVLLGGMAGQAARVAEADRARAALLATVSHDLRAPLAAAKAAVSGLRAGDARLPPTTARTCWPPQRSPWTGSPTSRPACWT
jgi:signal transduction histidine kinase